LHLLIFIISKVNGTFPIVIFHRCHAQPTYKPDRQLTKVHQTYAATAS
jgi:hypothetical protein